ncbi:MAG: uroporphyrinogen-III synthase [Gemmobacter sp.]|jgi:uroporphyrinogen-III synthase|nr:uroporphyrinogen-III synthase [Gemmobacter sp.]
MVRQSRTPPGTPPVILITRPAAQAARFAAALRERIAGARIVLSPLIAPDFVAFTVPERVFTAVILTSETTLEALRRLPGLRARLPDFAFCVGQRTAAAAAGMGFRPVSADGDAEALLTLILARRPEGPLLHLHGAEPSGTPAPRLTAAGIETLGVVTYRQAPQPLTAEAVAALSGSGVVHLPVFSPQTARVLAGYLAAPPGPAARLDFIAISEAAALPLREFGPVTVARRPDGPAMMAALCDRIRDNPRLEPEGPRGYPAGKGGDERA